jgi:hypothetical protein
LFRALAVGDRRIRALDDRSKVAPLASPTHLPGGLRPGTFVYDPNLWSRIDFWRRVGRKETLVSSGLVRFGGLAAMLAGTVFLVDQILGLMNPAPYLDAMFVVAMLLVLAGVVGFHALQQGHYGHLGQAGFYAVVVGILAQVLGLVLLLSGTMTLLWLVPVATLAVLVGFALHGVATL